MRNLGNSVEANADDDWQIGMLPGGTLSIVGLGGARQSWAFRSREAARPTNFTDQDFKVLLAEVISEMARLQVAAWFRKARRLV